jgi:hypothetical protein
MAEAAYGLPARQNMSVLDPKQAAYLQGYQQGEPLAYLGMASPFAAPAAVAGAKALAPKAGMMAENYMVKQGMMPSVVPQTRKDILEKQFNKTEQLNPNFLGDDLFEKGVKQAEFDDSNAYVRYLQDNKGNIRVLTLETENSPNVRGRQVLDWLKDTYKKPIKVNEVDTSASGYWDKMQKEGRIEDWSHKIYDGKIIE